MKNQTILIVDDNQDSLDLMREILTPHGYEVICTASGLRASQQETLPGGEQERNEAGTIT